MTAYFDPTRAGFVDGLVAGVQSFDERAEPFLLVHTPERGFSLEAKEEYSWISRAFSSSVYDAERNLAKLTECLQLEASRFQRTPHALTNAALLAERMRKLALHIEKKKEVSCKTLVEGFEQQSYDFVRRSCAASGRPAALIATELHLYPLAIRFLKETATYDAIVAFQDILYETALKCGELGVAIQFIERGASLQRAKELNLLNSLIYEAVEQRNEAVALQIIQVSVQIQPIPNRPYILHRAIQFQFSAFTIREFLVRGADPTYLDVIYNRTAGTSLSFTPLSLAVECGRYDVVPVLLERGANPNDLHPISHAPLIRYLIHAGQEQSAITAIEKGATVDYKDAIGRSLLHQAAKQGLKRLVPLLIQRGISPSVCDHLGETAAFGSSIQMIELLITHGLDPTITNQNKQTCINKLAIDTPVFRLQGVEFDLTRIKQDNGALTHIPAAFDRLQVCLFLQDDALSRRVASKMTQDQFDAAFWKLKAKYPKCSLDSVALAPYEINKNHLKKAFDLSKIPPKPPGENLKDLLMVFDTIDFRVKFKPSEYSPEFAHTTFQEFRESISKRVVDRVQQRVPDAGTGRQGTAFFVTFYDKLESALLHITKKVKALGNDPESMRKKAYLFFELSLHTPLCCEQLSQASCNWYNYLVRDIPTTLENYTLSTLTATREGILRSLITGIDQTNHDMHQLKYLIGKDFGIEGADFYTEPDAYRARYYPGKAVMLEKAMRCYTVNDCVESVHPQIIDFQTWRESARTHFMNNAPLTWRKEHYDAIRKQAQEMQANGCAEKAVKDYLATKEIYYQTGTALEAIEGDRAGAYYQDEVLIDPNKFAMHKHAVARMLNDFGVFETVFIGKRRTTVLASMVSRAQGYLRSWLPW